MPRHPNQAICTCSVCRVQFQNCMKWVQVDCILHPVQILMVYNFISVLGSFMGGWYLAYLIGEQQKERICYSSALTVTAWNPPCVGQNSVCHMCLSLYIPAWLPWNCTGCAFMQQNTAPGCSRCARLLKNGFAAIRGTPVSQVMIALIKLKFQWAEFQHGRASQMPWVTAGWHSPHCSVEHYLSWYPTWAR